MSRKDDLNEQLKSLREELYEIESRERENALDAMVGKFFKYRNCYSCPESEADKWWMYAAVYRVGDAVKYYSFQTDKDGKFSIEYNCRFFVSESWFPITKREFVAALKAARKRFDAFIKKSVGTV